MPPRLLLKKPPKSDTPLPRGKAPGWLELAAQTLGGMIGMPPLSPEDYTTPEGGQSIDRAGSLGELLGMAVPIGMAVKLGKTAKAAKSTGAPVESYRGLHTAPDRRGGAPLHNLTDKIYPDDVYSPLGQRYYGDSSPLDTGTFRVVHTARGNPEAEVTVYRAVPRDAGTPSINRGDWVTVNRQYAKQHGESVLDGDYVIVSKRVKARDIFTNGDSIHEWGYDPE